MAKIAITFLGYCFFTAILLWSPLNGHTAIPAVPAITLTNSWSSLTRAQQDALAPLANEWNQFTPDRKKKWLVMAEKIRHMNPDEQKRIQNKMQAWIKLTPEQRLAARENYIRSNKLQPDQRNQAWQNYQQLPDEQKVQLATHSAKKNLITNLPTPTESKIKKLPSLKTTDKTMTSQSSTSLTITH